MLLRLDTIQDEQGRHHVPDPKLKQLGGVIFDLYVQQVSSIRGYPVKVNPKEHIYFYRAAQLCLERGQTPDEFVRVQIEGMASIGKYWPRAIGCAAFMTESRSPERLRERDLYFYQSQLHLFKARVDLYGPKLALEDPANMFSPLFRAAMAYKYGFMEIFEQYKKEAGTEFRASETAREAFDDLERVLHE